MRKAPMAIAVIIAVATLSQTAAAETTLDVSNRHISLAIPSGWTYELNVSMGEGVADLEFESPVLGTSIAMGLLVSESWIGAATYDKLQNQFTIAVNSADDDDVLSVTVVSPAVNTTIDGMMAIDGRIDLAYSSSDVIERVVIIASDGWDMSWGFILAALDTDYSIYSGFFDSILSSIAIDEEPAGQGGTSPSSSLFVPMIAGGCAGAAAVAVLILIRAKKKGAEEEAQEDLLEVHSAPDVPIAIQVVSPESPTQPSHPPSAFSAQPSQASIDTPKPKTRRTLKKSSSQTEPVDQPPQA
jgi:hypothetical protein